MTPYLQDPDVVLYHGHVLDVLRELSAESIDCCITSPPYWGLRDYGTGTWEGGDSACEHSVGGQVEDSKAPRAIVSGQRPGVDASRCRHCGAHRIDNQLGLERTPLEYVAKMVEVFREVRRVLSSHGTVWLNLGDSYATDHAQRRSQVDDRGRSLNTGIHAKVEGSKAGELRGTPPGLKAKDLVGIPWRVAFALQDDGWYLRSDIIWAKPNPMPESITDRPTKSHEYVFLLSKKKNYFFDQEAVREPAEWNRWGDQTVPKYEGTDTATGWMKPRSKYELMMRGRESYPPGATTGNRGSEHIKGASGGMPSAHPAGRNIRTVWEIPTQPYAEAHFATFPEELPRRAILAGCPEKVCRVCGKAQERIIETNNPSLQDADDKTLAWANTHQKTSNPQSSKSLHRNPGGVYSSAIVVGVTDCGHADYRPGVVLDPFAGSGTTAFVARKQLRHSVLIELNEDYCKLIAKRLAQQSLFA